MSGSPCGCLEKQMLQHSRERKCSSNANDQPQQHQAESLPKHQLKDLMALGAQCHPNPKLLPPLRDRIRDDAVNPNRRAINKAHGGKHAHEQQRKPALGD